MNAITVSVTPFVSMVVCLQFVSHCDLVGDDNMTCRAQINIKLCVNANGTIILNC